MGDQRGAVLGEEVEFALVFGDQGVKLGGFAVDMGDDRFLLRLWRDVYSKLFYCLLADVGLPATIR